jgi:hypothetical protein
VFQRVSQVARKWGRFPGALRLVYAGAGAGGWPDEACEGRDFRPFDAEAVADEFVERLCCTEALHWVSERRGRFDHVT